jgi:hypothetical protein
MLITSCIQFILSTRQWNHHNFTKMKMITLIFEYYGRLMICRLKIKMFAYLIFSQN